MTESWGFYIDLSRCIGCHTCAVACRDWHGLTDSPSWMTVKTVEEGTYPAPRVTHMPIPCFHCEHPACMAACPVSAYTRCPDSGRVLLNQDLCIGCRQCQGACPYHVPQWNEGKQKMGKCDLCEDRLAQGKAPICVAACPMRALDAGPMTLLQTKYPEASRNPGFPYDHPTGPHVLLKQTT